MQEMVLILSRCHKKLKVKNGQSYSNIFSFNGYYQGGKIKQIRLSDSPTESFLVGHLYLIWVKKQSVSNHVLTGYALKSKLID